MRCNGSETKRKIVRVGALALSLAVFALPLVAEAQQGGKVYRIGELAEGPVFRDNKPFADAMRELGWVEGRNLTIERRSADTRAQLPARAAELVRLDVDLILTSGTAATVAAKEVTKTIPIVFNLGNDPVETGLVASFARPGGNLTGFALGLYDEKMLEVLKDAIPGLARVAYPMNAGYLAARNDKRRAAAQALGVALQGIPVEGAADIEQFFAAAKRAGVGAVLVHNSTRYSPHLERFGAAAAKSRLPAIGFQRAFAESGGLLSYGPAPGQNVPRLAAQIDKILKGARPADVPVEQPARYELVINLKTAKSLGITFAKSFIFRADHFIE